MSVSMVRGPDGPTVGRQPLWPPRSARLDLSGAPGQGCFVSGHLVTSHARKGHYTDRSSHAQPRLQAILRDILAIIARGHSTFLDFFCVIVKCGLRLNSLTSLRSTGLASRSPDSWRQGGAGCSSGEPCRPRPGSLHGRGAPPPRRVAAGPWSRACSRRSSSSSSWSAWPWCCATSPPARASAAATVSIVVKTLALYTIMVTGSIWEKRGIRPLAVRAGLLLGGRVQHAGAGAAHGLPRGAAHRRARRRASRWLLALAAYATYVDQRHPVPAQAARAPGCSSRDRPACAPERDGRRRAGCSDAPVLRERGQREVFCGLTGIIWLHRKIQDAFFLVVGSRTCAHLIQSAAGVMIFAEPRFATAIIEERDLAGLADANEELDRVVARLLERRPDIKLLFLVGSCPSEVIKLDLSRAAAAAVADLRARGARPQLFGQRHRDDLHPGRGCLPRRAGARACRRVGAEPARCWSWARWPTWSRTSSRGCSPNWASGRCASCRRAAPASCRRSAPHTRFLLAQPFLAETARALEERGAVRLAAPFPLGVEGTTPGCSAAADAFGVDPARVRAGRSAPASRAGRNARWRATARCSPASASSSSPTRSSRCRSPASSRASSAWRWSRSARPICTASIWRPSSTLLPRGTALSEGQDVDRQLDRCRAARPDLVVCGLGLANPLEAEGMTTKWAIELVFTPIQGFEQAGDLAELFARPLDRRTRLVA